MNKAEAQTLLSRVMRAWRRRPYAVLAAEVDAEPEVLELEGESGETYQVAVQAFWDGAPCGDVRVLGSINDRGIRAFCPLTNDFIMRPSGEFVDE